MPTGLSKKLTGAKLPFSGPILFALTAACLPNSVAHAQDTNPLEPVAAAVVTEFTRLCAAAALDPSGFLTTVGDIPDSEPVTSVDGNVHSLTYERDLDTADGAIMSASVTIATLEPGLWVLDCGVDAYVETDAHELTDQAFRTALSNLPDAKSVGGAMPRFEAEEVNPAIGGFSDQPRYLYFVTNWLPEDPLLHLYAGLGDVGFDLWTHRLVDRR